MLTRFDLFLEFILETREERRMIFQSSRREQQIRVKVKNEEKKLTSDPFLTYLR